MTSSNLPGTIKLSEKSLKIEKLTLHVKNHANEKRALKWAKREEKQK